MQSQQHISGTALTGAAKSKFIKFALGALLCILGYALGYASSVGQWKYTPFSVGLPRECKLPIYSIDHWAVQDFFYPAFAVDKYLVRPGFWRSESDEYYEKLKLKTAVRNTSTR